MKGLYRFFVDGKLVCEQSNVVTNLGKQAILRYLAGQGSYYGGLALGAGASTPDVTQTDLDYEYARTPILYSSPDFSTNDVVYKGNIGRGLAGRVYEAGLFSKEVNAVAGEYSSRMLATFDNIEPWTNATLLDTTANRLGTQAIQDDITTANGTVAHVNTAINLDLNGYSSSDQFALAFITYYDYVARIDVKFTDSKNGTATGSFVPAAHIAGTNVAQYQIIKVAKSAFTIASIDWTDVSSITVTTVAKATASVTNRAKLSLDGLRIFDTDTINPDYVLVSRSTLVTPIVLLATQSLDIEYRLRFNI